MNIELLVIDPQNDFCDPSGNQFFSKTNNAYYTEDNKLYRFKMK